jgi:hypothetical protein
MSGTEADAGGSGLQGVIAAPAETSVHGTRMTRIGRILTDLFSVPPVPKLRAWEPARMRRSGPCPRYFGDLQGYWFLLFAGMARSYGKLAEALNI